MSSDRQGCLSNVYLARHGETDPPGLVLGQFDAPLSETGLAQAVHLAQTLSRESIDLVVSSSLRRSLQTAQKIASAVGRAVHSDSRLNEITYGDWDGLTWDEIEGRDPETAARKLQDWWSATPSGGEEPAEFYRRVERAWVELTDRPEASIAIVGHAAVNAVLVDLARRRQNGDRGPDWARIAQFQQQHGELIRLELHTNEPN